MTRLRHALISFICFSAISMICWYTYQLYTFPWSEEKTSEDEAETQVPSNNTSLFKQRFSGTLGDSLQLNIINSSFLHNASRNYYGDSLPERLDVIWKHKLGQGYTRIGKDSFLWKGAGWTGQPLLAEENGKLFIIQGAYDHHLKKINAQTGELVWQYKFDDVIKGTGSIWINPDATSPKDFCIVMQGSRAGKNNYSKTIPSFKAISYLTGEPCWHMNSSRTRCYSRDVDASCLVLNDTAYIGLENGIFTVFDPNPKNAHEQQELLQPYIFKNSDTLYYKSDIKKHGGNLVTEASPVLLGNHIYIASGSGHIWGYNLDTDSIDWDFFVGSDIDGTPTITVDSCLLIAIEKQYIKGNGGLLKIDPSLPPSKAVKWYFPTDSIGFEDWEGGIIGSAATNLSSRTEQQPHLAVFTGLDGFLYVLDVLNTEGTSVLFDGKTKVPSPKLIWKHKTGPSISTPIIINNRIVAATYKRTYLFEFDAQLQFKLLAEEKIRCESTPVAYRGRVYLPSRNGYLYCLGTKESL